MNFVPCNFALFYFAHNNFDYCPPTSQRSAPHNLRPSCGGALQVRGERAAGAGGGEMRLRAQGSRGAQAWRRGWATVVQRTRPSRRAAPAQAVAGLLWNMRCGTGRVRFLGQAPHEVMLMLRSFFPSGTVEIKGIYPQ